MPQWPRILVHKVMSVSGFEPQSTGPKPSALTTRPPRLVYLQCWFRWCSSPLVLLLPGMCLLSMPQAPEDDDLIWICASMWNRYHGRQSIVPLFPLFSLVSNGAWSRIRCSFYGFEHEAGTSKMSAPIVVCLAWAYKSFLAQCSVVSPSSLHTQVCILSLSITLSSQK